MLRDRIVVGIADSSLSKRLQMIEDLTLEKAMTLVRQREAVHKQQLTLKGQMKSEPQLDAVQHYPSSKGKSPTTGKAVGKSASQHQPPTRSSVQSQHQATCIRCRRGSHPRQQCLARDADCHKCTNGDTIYEGLTVQNQACR